MLDTVVIFLDKDSSDRIGGSGDIQDEVPIKVRRADQGSGCESLLEGIERLVSMGISKKRDRRSEESKEPMCSGGVVRDEPSKKISFALETLELAEGTWNGKFKNGLNFQRVKSDSILRHDEA